MHLDREFVALAGRQLAGDGVAAAAAAEYGVDESAHSGDADGQHDLSSAQAPVEMVDAVAEAAEVRLLSAHAVTFLV